MVIDIVVSSDSNIRKEYKKLEVPGPEGETLECKSKVAPVVVELLRVVNPMLGEWLQQISRTTSLSKRVQH